MKLFHENSIFWNIEIESDNFTVWNSEIIRFDFTEKSLLFIEKYKRKSHLRADKYGTCTVETR